MLDSLEKYMCDYVTGSAQYIYWSPAIPCPFSGLLEIPTS